MSTRPKLLFKRVVITGERAEQTPSVSVASTAPVSSPATSWKAIGERLKPNATTTQTVTLQPTHDASLIAAAAASTTVLHHIKSSESSVEPVSSILVTSSASVCVDSLSSHMPIVDDGLSLAAQRRINARKNWAKFGECAHLPPRSEATFDPVSGAITHLNQSAPPHTDSLDDIRLLANSLLRWTIVDANEFDLVLKAQPMYAPPTEDSGVAIKVSCKLCGGQHFTAKCPTAKRTNVVIDAPPARSLPAKKTGHYVPPSRRIAASTALSSWSAVESSYDNERNRKQVHISNLPFNTSRNDIFQLCSRIGHVHKVNMSRSGNACWVEFTNSPDVQRAIDRLNHHRYGNNVITVTLAENNTSSRVPHARPTPSSATRHQPSVAYEYDDEATDDKYYEEVERFEHMVKP